MLTTNVRRGVVALATALSVLAIMATPASAHPYMIVSGTIQIGTPPGQQFTFPGEEEDKCTVPIDPAVNQVIDINFTGNGSTGNWTADNWDNPATGVGLDPIKARFRLDPPNDAQYWQADMSLLTGQGTYSGTAPNYSLASTGTHVTIQAQLYRLDPADGCLKDDLACTVRARIVVGSPSTATVAAMPTVGAGDSVSLSATSNTTGGIAVTAVTACPATINSQLVTKHVTAALGLTA